MARQKLIPVKDMRQKLAALYSRTQMADDPALHIRNDDEFATVLSIGASTLSEWINGKDNDKEKSERMSPEGIKMTVQHLEKVLDHKLGIPQLIELWQSESSEGFQHALLRYPSLTIDEVLSKVSHGLAMDVIVNTSHKRLVKYKRSAEKEMRKIPLNADYAIDIDAQPGTSCMVLCQSSQGLQLLAPAPWHDGTVKQNPERIPSNGGLFTFDEYEGPYRFIAIEFESPNISREIDIQDSEAPLEKSEQLNIGRFLNSEIGSWRWGECLVYAERQDQ